ncbi:MAG: SEC-C metal-binding domain-containing protein [Fimbriimonas sp.]
MSSAFEPLSKRRRGYPSETNVQRGLRVVHGEKELFEKLGKEDPCPCGSGRRFRRLLPQLRPLRRRESRLLRTRVMRSPLSPCDCHGRGGWG